MDTSQKSTDNSKFSQPFKDMAERIERNLPEEFSGAILIVPPTGEPIAVMIADPTRDMEAFWAMAVGKVQIAAQEHQQSKPGFGQRR